VEIRHRQQLGLSISEPLRAGQALRVQRDPAAG
jgi:hypothetical protein